MTQVRNHNLLCEIKHIAGVPYHTVRPTAVIRIESWPDMLFYAEMEFIKVTPFEPAIVGTVGRPPVLGERVYVDNTRFWFKYKADCDQFVEYWS